MSEHVDGMNSAHGAPYGEQIANVPAHTHEENARKFFEQHPEQAVSRIHRRGDNPVFVHYEDMPYLSENPSDKLDKILAKIEDEGEYVPTYEELADHFNQGLIAEGRQPVFSAQMLAAQSAAELRKKQKARKKKKRK
uniref:Uncharacterized protein n=1 Tax=Pseudomonas phage HRDY3 TaxID=3236930 RepID=A0AB39CE91_9VIRU